MWWTMFAGMSVGLILAAQQVPVGQTPATGAIAGRVVDAVSGAPVPGVIVALSGAVTDAVRRQVLSDGEGRFVFLGVPKGEYRLRTSTGGRGFSPSGFLVSGLGHLVGGYLDGGFGQRRPDGPLAPIDLSDAERATDVGIRLWRGAAIEGTVFDEAGEPLVGQFVAAARRSSDGRLLTGPSTQTDDRGAYRLPTLIPGDYVVVVPQRQVLLPATLVESATAAPLEAATTFRLTSTGMNASPAAGGLRTGSVVHTPPSSAAVTNGLFPVARAGGRSFVYQTTFFPSASAVARATVVTLKSAEERTGVDVHLQPVAAVEVSGTLTDGRDPIANFGIRLLPADSGDDSSVLEAATTVTDGRGVFTFPLVAPGSYTVVAMRAPAGPGAPPSPDPILGAWASQPVSVGDQPVRAIALTLRHGVALSGRVEFQGAAARPTGRALSQVVIERLQRISRTSAANYVATLAETGDFAFFNVAPGRYTLRIADVLPNWTLISATVAGRDVLATGLTVGDDDLTGLALTFTDQPAAIVGTVRNQRGDADPDAAVFVFPADRSGWRDARAHTRAFRVARASKTGAFALANIAAGSYLVVAVDDAVAGDWPDEGFLQKLAQLATTVRVGLGERPTLALRRAEVR